MKEKVKTFENSKLIFYSVKISIKTINRLSQDIL
jgi:hypothetical protein